MAKTKATIKKNLVSYKKTPSGKVEKLTVIGKPKEMKMKSISAKQFFKK
jgi:hypothetical protein